VIQVGEKVNNFFQFFCNLFEKFERIASVAIKSSFSTTRIIAENFFSQPAPTQLLGPDRIQDYDFFRGANFLRKLQNPAIQDQSCVIIKRIFLNFNRKILKNLDMVLTKCISGF
jgi:hypothetical protein